jgi:hypothetical protein
MSLTVYNSSGIPKQVLAGTTLELIVREVPAGDIDGANVTFSLAHTVVAGAEQLYLNGVLQQAGAGADYTINGTAITMTTAPLAEDSLLATYVKSS